VNPFFGPASAAPEMQMNNVFRVYRYTEAEIAKAVCKMERPFKAAMPAFEPA
jgi:hypothetical protein